MRIRTIPEAAKTLKEEDPDCGITEWTLRRMVKDGTLPEVRVGTKYLIDLDKVKELFCAVNMGGTPQ